MFIIMAPSRMLIPRDAAEQIPRGKAPLGMTSFAWMNGEGLTMEAEK